jgi:predicted nucleic acid-binding Zn finger protein
MPVLTRGELLSRYADRSSSKYVERAVDAVLQGRVKEHVFLPSNHAVYTVVGRNGDEFIDSGLPFCSCSHFFFSVMRGKSKTCYHLLANSIASEWNLATRTEFHDEEFPYFLKLIASDLLARQGDKEDKDNSEPSDTGPR